MLSDFLVLQLSFENTDWSSLILNLPLANFVILDNLLNFSKLETGNQWLTDQIQPTACFCMVCEMRIVFPFLNIEKNQKKNNISRHKNYIQFIF